MKLAKEVFHYIHFILLCNNLLPYLGHVFAGIIDTSGLPTLLQCSTHSSRVLPYKNSCDIEGLVNAAVTVKLSSGGRLREVLEFKA